MRITIETLIHEMESRLGGYVTLLVYRYANLCVKAQPLSLLSAQIIDEEMGEMKLEQVAGVMLLDEYHLKLVPFDPRFNFPLCKAIKLEHPEFKQDLVKPENGEEDERILILTMPEVNKDRRDVLIDSVNVLFDGCKAKMDKTSAEYRLKLEKKIVTLPTDDERNEAKDALDSSIKNHQGIVDKVKEDKVKEIEEAYQRYLDEQTSKRNQADETAAARGEHAGRQMRVGDSDE
ncbi:MAG: ribosome-recycling factor [Prevotella sp.]|nr:ribosome-recycling factor [Prevotella sp.]